MSTYSALRCLLGCSIFVTALFVGGCSTGASDLKLSEVSNEDGIFFGHIDFYDGADRIAEDGNLHRCFVWFETEDGSTIAKVKMDESSWLFIAAPPGRVYLSDVMCNTGFLQSHPELKSRDLYFPVASGLANYFGHLTVHFPRHGVNLGGALFGAVGAGIEALSSTSGAQKIEVQDNFLAAKDEYVKRYGAVSPPKKFSDHPIMLPSPVPSPSPK